MHKSTRRVRHVGHVAREEEKTLDTRKGGHESTWTLGAREDVGNEAREACEAREHVEHESLQFTRHVRHERTWSCNLADHRNITHSVEGI